MTTKSTKQAVEAVLAGGLSKYRLAKMLGVQPIMINHYLVKTRMTQATAHKMHLLFNITISDKR